MSISPNFTDSNVLGVEDGDEEDEADVPTGFEEELGERTGLPKEDEVIKKLVGPKLPSQEDVEMHYLRGHLPFQTWCPICVKAKAHEMPVWELAGGKHREMR